MKKLVGEDGLLRFGLYEEAVDHVNYRDYLLETPMGRSVPSILKRLMVNQFVFIGIVGPEVMLGMAMIDLKYLASAFFYVYDRKTGTVTDAKKTTLSSNIRIAPYPDKLLCRFTSDTLAIVSDCGQISARGNAISFDGETDLTDTNPLRLCTRAGYSGWTYTQKTTPVNVSGHIRVNDKHIRVSWPEYMGVIDWTAGYMRNQTFWNWASAAHYLPDRRPFGLNLSWGVNETGFTENAFWVDGKMTKVDTVSFQFNRHNLSEPWRIVSQDKKVSLCFYPECRRQEKINALVLASKFTQLMGRFEGHLMTDDSEKIEVIDCPGWAEDHFARW